MKRAVLHDARDLGREMTMMASPTIRVALALLLGLVSTGGGPAPAGYAILPGSTVRTMLQQCSRASPPPGEATWQPAPADIAALERALPRALSQTNQGRRLDWAHVTDVWDRQYVGILRGGRRIVYGNFFPHRENMPAANGFDWRRQPFAVCDGGSSFFGVEYEVQARAFLSITFNGYA